MLTIDSLIRAAAALPEVPGEVHVSPMMFEQLKRYGNPKVDLVPTLCGVRIVANVGYRPDWWSEHYPEHIDLHAGDKGVIRIPAGYRPRPFNFSKEAHDRAH